MVKTARVRLLAIMPVAEIMVPALLCQCFRCQPGAEGWLVVPRALGEKPKAPKVCPYCKSRSWNVRPGSRKSPGRPRIHKR